jgi:starch-binding outer membrane protein, SusD/RagB family
LSRIYLFMSGTYEAPNSENAQLAIDYATRVIIFFI